MLKNDRYEDWTKSLIHEQKPMNLPLKKHKIINNKLSSTSFRD